jgi:hypothetical protein
MRNNLAGMGNMLAPARRDLVIVCTMSARLRSQMVSTRSIVAMVSSYRGDVAQVRWHCAITM